MSNSNINAQETVDKIIKYQETEDRAILGELCKDCEDVVGWIVKKHGNNNIPREDMIQECNISLIKALKRFDASKNAKVSSWIILNMKHDLLDYIANNMREVRLHTTKPQRKAFYNVIKLSKKYSEDNGFYLSVRVAKKIAEELEIDIEIVEDIYFRLNNASYSFDRQTTTQQGTFDSHAGDLYETFYQDDSNDPAKIYERKEIKELNSRKLRETIDNLKIEHKNVIDKRWMVEDGETLTAMGIDAGVSPEAMRLRQNRAFKLIEEDLIRV